MQPLKGEFAERVCLLVSQRKQEGAINEDLLFVCYDKFGKPKKTLSVKTLYRMFKYYSKEAGLEAAPHAARAAAITKLLKDGVRLIDVQRFARHHSWHTVCIYDHRRLEIETAPSPDFF